MTPPQRLSDQLLEALSALARPDAIPGVARFFVGNPGSSPGERAFLGVPIGAVFPVARRFMAMPLPEIEALLDHPCYELRMAAVSVMDFQARARRTPPAQRQALFELYLRRHDRIDNWDLVDRAAPHVVGAWLDDKPRDPLYELARSMNPWERRTAIVSTWFFIRQGQLDDTFQIAALLVEDPHAYVQKAVGSWVREAGKRDPQRLVDFLATHAARMPRATLRAAREGSRAVTSARSGD